MALGDLNLVSFLKTKMQWHQARQQVLAQNVANADTPGYRPKDLSPIGFERHLSAIGLDPVAPARTNAAHIQGTAMQRSGGVFARGDGTGWEVTPGGNAVVLEEQMIKVSANQFDYQMASTLYARSLGLLRTAMGRGGA